VQNPVDDDAIEEERREKGKRRGITVSGEIRVR
jgi:hypothetical protein